MIQVGTVRATAVTDGRGMLAATQFPEQLPFAPMRVFVVSNCPAGTERGGHAHRSCHQVLVATAGAIVVEFDDDNGTGEVTLSASTEFLHIPPLVWAKQTYTTDGSSLVVLASHTYDANDYIDDRYEAKLMREGVLPVTDRTR